MTTNRVLNLRELDRPVVKERMFRFHGYPYTSIGVVLIKP